MSPLPNTRVIAADWAAHHRPVVQGTFTATVSIRRPGGTPGAFDPDLGSAPIVPYDPHHAGAARIQVLSTQDQVALAGEQQVTTLAYLVTVAHDAATGATDFAVGDLVHVDAVDDNGDLTLVGRTLTVESVPRGSLAFERDLFCTDNLG